MNKFTLLILGVVSAFTSFAQEINVGASFGGGVSPDNLGIFSTGVLVEYKPLKSILSFNVEPTVLYYSKNNIYPVYPDYTVCSVPVYLKVIMGKKLRFAPFAGGFITTTSSYGITAGLNVEYRIKERFALYLKNDFNQVFYQTAVISDAGNPEMVQRTSSLIWVSIGAKFNMYKPKEGRGIVF